MRASTLPDRIPDILDRVNLVELVAEYAGEQGHPRNGAWLFRCPLPDHDDRDPSFAVREHRGRWTWRCWSQCDAYGDAIDLYMRVHGVSKQEAIDRLAARVGLDGEPATAPPPRPVRPRKSVSARPPAYTAETLAAWVDRCHRALWHTPHALAYLRSRGLEDDLIRRWRLGFGVAGSYPFGTLRGRVIVPCPGGAEGRLVPSHESATRHGEAKYLALPTDPKTPWGLDRLDPRHGPLTLVEGVFDAFALASCGFAVVALRGKAVTPATAQAIAEAGYARVWLGLDADVPIERWRERVAALARADVRARAVIGPATGDWGDLLALPPDERADQLARALIDPGQAVA